MALLTSDAEVIQDINKVFAVLERKIEVPSFKHLLVAQFNMVPALKEMIDQEIRHVETGKKGRIILKMNGLQDRSMIRELYRASEKGVEIDLIIRGICCLIPNQLYSKNIRITRIVDMFLEHARIWYFYNDGKEDLFLTSADWMKRNLSRRIETAFPILQEDIKQEIIDILHLQLADNKKGCYINEKLENCPKYDHLPPVRSQIEIYQYLQNKILGSSGK